MFRKKTDRQRGRTYEQQNYGKRIYHKDNAKHLALPDHGLTLQNNVLLIGFTVMLLSSAVLAQTNQLTFTHRSPGHDKKLNNVEATVKFHPHDDITDLAPSLYMVHLNISHGESVVGVDCQPDAKGINDQHPACRIDAVQRGDVIGARAIKAKVPMSLTGSSRNKSEDHQFTVGHASKPSAPTSMFTVFSAISESAETKVAAYHSDKEPQRLTLSHTDQSAGQFSDKTHVNNVVASIEGDKATTVLSKAGLSVKADCSLNGETSKNCDVTILEEGNTITLQVRGSDSTDAIQFPESQDPRNGHECDEDRTFYVNHLEECAGPPRHRVCNHYYKQYVTRPVTTECFDQDPKQTPGKQYHLFFDADKKQKDTSMTFETDRGKTNQATTTVKFV